MKSPSFPFYFGALLAFTSLSVVSAEPEAAADATEEEAEGDFIRFLEEDDHAVLETAVAHFENAEGVTVDLIGAVHIADKGYYEKLNEDFKGYDTLLYEMVGDPNAAEDVAAKKSAGNALRFFQNMMKNMLALDFQLDTIDYTAANFVHADMDWKTFVDMRKERGENIVGMMMKSWEYQAKQAVKGEANNGFDLGAMMGVLMSNDTPTAMKLVFGRQFQDAEAMINGIEGEEGSVIVAERNKVALGVLKDRIAKGEKNLGIFYGAAHFPDMAKRLTDEMGFRPTGTDWNPAWDIDKKLMRPPGAGKAENDEGATEREESEEPKSIDEAA